MKSTLSASIFCALAALAAVACDHEDAPPATAASTSTTSSTTASATDNARAAKPVNKDQIDTLAKTMCDREQSCDNIGAGKKYATREVCIMQNKSDGMNDLTNEGCPFGIDKYAYDRCLADIKGDKCDNVVDHLSRMNSCSKSSLCPR